MLYEKAAAANSFSFPVTEAPLRFFLGVTGVSSAEAPLRFLLGVTGVSSAEAPLRFFLGVLWWVEVLPRRCKVAVWDVLGVTGVSSAEARGCFSNAPDCPPSAALLCFTTAFGRMGGGVMFHVGLKVPFSPARQDK